MLCQLALLDDFRGIKLPWDSSGTQKGKKGAAKLRNLVPSCSAGSVQHRDE